MHNPFHRHERLGLFCLIITLTTASNNALAQAGRVRGNVNPVSTTARVIAVADEHSNSIIASGSEDQLEVIARILTSLDLDVTDLTEVRIFQLKNADPEETAALLSSVFPDSTTVVDSRGGGATGAIAGVAESERVRKRGATIAVADPRTRSIVVSAARQLMPQIEIIVMRLDSDPARKRFVRIYQLKNSTTPDVSAVLRSIFGGSAGASTTETDALKTRADQAAQRQPTSGLDSGSTRSSSAGGGTGSNR